MQKSYVVKSPINFANFAFFVKIGDILVHDPANGNKLTVYRNGEIVKAIAQTPLGMAAILKQGFIAELGVTPTAASTTPPKPAEASKKAIPAPGVPIPKEDFDKLKKRGKKEPKETSRTTGPGILSGEDKKQLATALLAGFHTEPGEFAPPSKPAPVDDETL